MLHWITSVSVHRWAIVLTMTLVYCVFAWGRFRSLPIEAFPDVTNPMIEVVGLYPGQAAEEVERRVTIELERAARRGYLALLGGFDRWRWLSLPASLAAIAAMGVYASGIGTEFLPELNEGGLYITAVFPSTISLDESSRQATVGPRANVCGSRSPLGAGLRMSCPGDASMQGRRLEAGGLPQRGTEA